MNLSYDFLSLYNGVLWQIENGYRLVPGVREELSEIVSVIVKMCIKESKGRDRLCRTKVEMLNKVAQDFCFGLK